MPMYVSTVRTMHAQCVEELKCATSMHVHYIKELWCDPQMAQGADSVPMLFTCSLPYQVDVVCELNMAKDSPISC